MVMAIACLHMAGPSSAVPSLFKAQVAWQMLTIPSVLLLRRLMCDAGIRLNRPGMRTAGHADLLKEFAEACKELQFEPSLNSREAKFLANLQTERIY